MHSIRSNARTRAVSSRRERSGSKSEDILQCFAIRVKACLTKTVAFGGTTIAQYFSRVSVFLARNSTGSLDRNDGGIYVSSNGSRKEGFNDVSARRALDEYSLTF